MNTQCLTATDLIMFIEITQMSWEMMSSTVIKLTSQTGAEFLWEANKSFKGFWCIVTGEL